MLSTRVLTRALVLPKRYFPLPVRDSLQENLKLQKEYIVALKAKEKAQEELIDDLKGNLELRDKLIQSQRIYISMLEVFLTITSITLILT